MTFRFTVEGQPPSVNHLYEPSRYGGKHKAPGVEAYQELAAHKTRLAKPKGWVPGDQIRVYYDFYLNREADCDNLQKALNDAIAQALGVNDKSFLPCSRSKVSGVRRAEARVEVELVNA